MSISKFDTEKLVGVQLRAIAGDVGEAFRTKLRELYDDSDSGKSCYKWHVIVTNYFLNTSKYTPIIQLAYKKGIILDEYEPWKMLMRIDMSDEFIRLIGNFTQIPQLAVRDVQEERERGVEYSPWD